MVTKCIIVVYVATHVMFVMFGYSANRTNIYRLSSDSVSYRIRIPLFGSHDSIYSYDAYGSEL